MSEAEVVYRVVDRAGNVHRLKAVRLVTEPCGTAMFYNAARDEVASFASPAAVTLDTAEMVSGRPLEMGQALSTVIQSSSGMSSPLVWVSAASWLALVALVALRVYEFFAYSR
jgi:hypothetical protein